MKLIRVG